MLNVQHNSGTGILAVPRAAEFLVINIHHKVHYCSN